MVAFVVTIHVLVCLFLIFVILLQPGKGDGMGGALGGGGGGGSSSVFGSRGSVSFLAKVTEVCAVIFMVTSLTLAYRSSHSASVIAARRNIEAADAAKKAPGAPGAGADKPLTPPAAQSTPPATKVPPVDTTPAPTTPPRAPAKPK